jgi:NIMA (never in mitosis gene a)-related kinase
MKQINTAKMSQKLKKEALNEVEILSRIDSCYVVKYFDSFIDKNYLCIIMEYCELGDLHKALKGQFGRPLSENSIWAYFIQMLLGLNHLHSLKILHRDLKTLNVFLAKDN